MTRVEKVDVVIVGARCAGAAAAAPLARAGRSVVVVDKSRFPSDTMSTHVLVPNGVQELQRQGALDAILAMNPSRSRFLTLQDGDVEIRERFRPFSGIDFGLCIPRTLQDKALVDAARAAGAEIREGVNVDSVVHTDGRVAGVRCRTKTDEYEIHASLVVGADGRRSQVAAEVGSWEPYRSSRNGRGFAFRYVDDPMGDDAPDAMQIYREEGDSVLVLPSCPAGRMVVVNMVDAALIPRFRADPDAEWEGVMQRNPRVRERIEGATNVSSQRTTADLASYYRRSSGPGWALAGDSGHFKDPTTGNGMRDALKFGRLLGETAAVHLDDPVELDAAVRRWEAERDADTISTYHWGNRETRPGPTSPLIREVLRTFSGSTGPNLSDTFNRARPVEAVISPRRLVVGLSRTLRTPGVDRGAVLREVLQEIPIEYGMRRHRLFDGFRSCRPTASEHPGAEFSRRPSVRTAQGDRPPESGRVSSPDGDAVLARDRQS
ncbi:NAD(P)/FAD-dependent oxidoreductase [Pseudonocardia endophytica]|uniref:2-polyprenyl-6-methoxyphenol hydroxylase-like FAD-dependent oxidoreductase n=1 Tax=Pseudonocardia endophytica TaxID=401976 RepID=A0A4R1I876_PSEEN|nr:NAD(P)/FAD-dependent oxidoreductase [Pseudonocardia endophytica]TCK26352.1 2-polyprenyl-6-methoxyphenol hydroxylase-like FAD-dependent oxidoreductase [Pseudonocardia endophytica]